MADKETARALMREGRARRAAGDHRGALESFAGADAIMHLPTTRFEVGRAQAQLGLLLEARDTLLAVARDPEEPGEPPQFKAARTEASTLAREIAPRIPSLRIRFAGAPAGATVELSIDDVPVAATALEVPRKVNPGKHRIVAKVGAVTRSMDVELAEREERAVVFDLGGAPPVVATGGSKGGRAFNAPLWIGLGVTSLGVVTGGVAGIVHLSKVADLRDQCPGGHCSADLGDDVSRARTWGTVSTISFAVAGAGAALATWAWLRPSPTAHVGVAPFVGVASFGVVGAF